MVVKSSGCGILKKMLMSNKKVIFLMDDRVLTGFPKTVARRGESVVIR